ncbi:MAG: response regulator transcription factor [Terriglobales bacterium]
MAKILVVEDDKEISKLIHDYLRFEHHTVDVAYDGAAALDYLRASRYEVIVLDWMLPGKTGIEVCKTVRSWGGSTGILMLTGKHDISEKEVGLDAGADDYLTKPFHARELNARVRALLRRTGDKIAENELRVGDIVLIPSEYKVSRGSEELKLMKKEFALLEFLMRHKGTVFDAEALVTRVWPAETETSAEMIRTHIKNLRKKLDVEGQPSIIRTVPRVGYAVQDPN